MNYTSRKGSELVFHHFDILVILSRLYTALVASEMLMSNFQLCYTFEHLHLRETTTKSLFLKDMCR